jgi:hypothetical protein
LTALILNRRCVAEPRHFCSAPAWGKKFIWFQGLVRPEFFLLVSKIEIVMQGIQLEKLKTVEILFYTKVYSSRSRAARAAKMNRKHRMKIFSPIITGSEDLGAALNASLYNLQDYKGKTRNYVMKTMYKMVH